jgi:ElaA protein
MAGEQVKVKAFEQLTSNELYAILQARSQVFVVEQQCIYQDLDGLDESSLHVFYEQGGAVRAYLRLFYKDPAQRIVQLGRVLSSERGKGWGGLILGEGIQAAKERLRAREIYIEAQSYAIGFYEQAGFKVVSEEFLEDGIPHVQMLLKF